MQPRGGWFGWGGGLKSALDSFFTHVTVISRVQHVSGSPGGKTSCLRCDVWQGMPAQIKQTSNSESIPFQFLGKIE